MRPEPARPLRRAAPLRLRPPVRSRPPTAPGVAPGVACGATTVCTGEGKGVGVAGVLKGVDDTVGVAVCVAVDVGVGICAEAVGVGVWAIAVAAGVCVLAGVPVALGVASWASAMPPMTAAYRPAQQRAMARIFLGGKLALLHARGAGREGTTPLNFGIGRATLEQSKHPMHDMPAISLSTRG